MSQRFVYLIDADANLDAHLVGELARYGFRVEASADSNDLMQRKDDLPSLVVLCIDPKRTGWAVCNRLRKSMTLKTTPLIITSAEATEKDFEDHKKLKTRAEEYLHKPFGVEAIVDKIGGLIGMPDPVESSTHSLEIPMESEEVAIEDDGAIIEEEAADDGGGLYGGAAAHNAGGFDASDDEEDRTRIGVMNIDGEVDVETEAAFAAIGNDAFEDSTNVMPPEEVRPVLARVAPIKRAVAPMQVQEVPLDDPFSGSSEDDAFMLPHDAGASVPAPLPPAESQPIQTHHVFAKDSSGPIDLGLEAVAEQAAQEPVRPRAASQPRITPLPRMPGMMASASAPSASPLPVVSSSPADTAAHDTGLAAVTELKRERDGLKREVEELQKKLAAKPMEVVPSPSSGFSREREFLNLRETINKKEREVLDLKDAADVKERQVLDAATKLRELERKVGDLEARGLGTEKELVAAKEKIEALASDKERSVEREKQVKARLDDALKSIARYEEEIEGWKQKHAADVGQAEQAYNVAIAAHQSEVQSLKQQHQASLDAQAADHGERMQKAVDAHEEDKALLAARYDDERGRMEAESAQAMESLRDASQNERDGLRLRYEQETADMAQKHDAAVQKLRQEVAATVAQLKSEHAEAVTEKDQLHADEIAGLRARYTRDAKESERRHQDELGGVHESYKKELQAAEDRRLTELAQKGQESRAELEALANDHGAERQRLEQDHILALHALDERRQSELREAAEAHANELARSRQEFEKRIADEIKNARDQHMRKMQALEESHADLKAGMQQRHAQQIEELKKEHGGVVSEYDAAIAQRDQLITDGHERISDLEQQIGDRDLEAKKTTARLSEIEVRLKTALEDLNAREATLNERAARIAEMEQESAGYQDQILKAYQRIKSDESIVSRAKKALAIALTLLDESAPDPGDEASS
ncbi:MAG: response regulator receiver [Myxococcales bacterium]|nr:response regulator receiver [Myxococcales bacterium]